MDILVNILAVVGAAVVLLFLFAVVLKYKEDRFGGNETRFLEKIAEEALSVLDYKKLVSFCSVDLKERLESGNNLEKNFLKWEKEFGRFKKYRVIGDYEGEHYYLSTYYIIEVEFDNETIMTGIDIIEAKEGLQISGISIFAYPKELFSSKTRKSDDT